MDRETELALVRRLRDGDEAAFDAVFDEFHARLYAFLARLSRRREVAEDLVEETWLRLVANASRLNLDTRLGPWLFTVARNLHVSYCRSRLVDASLAADLIGVWPVSPPEPSPFETLAASELERQVERALGTLPAIYREALLLVAAEGFSPAEAAAVCAVTPEALRQRLLRARALLARELETKIARDSHVLREVMT